MQAMADPFEELIDRFKRFDVDIFKEVGQYQRQDFISLNEHLSQRHIEHSDKLRRRICVYLDLKYWIYIRDARSGSPQSPSHLRLLELLETLLRDDKVVCPVSSSTLFETAKIHDRSKREAMAAVVDEFSQGIAVRPMKERIQLEFFERWSKRDNAPRQHRVARRSIWTQPSLALGLPVMAPPKEIPPKIAKARAF
jgi:hypothetical protein